LTPAGRAYLGKTIPKLAEALCQPDVRKQIDTVVVEGHSDKKGFGLGSEQADEQENLKLSQQRSMAVVSESLSLLNEHRACFLELLSATGRGDAHPLNTRNLYSPENRRVEIRIRIKSEFAHAAAAGLGPQQPATSIATPASQAGLAVAAN
jgi:chemotaxis protein MotB